VSLWSFIAEIMLQGKESLLADGGDYYSSSLREKEATWTVVTNKFRVEKKYVVER
jgi:hypothetical protein